MITLRLAVARPDLVRGVLVHEPPLRSLLSDGGVNGPLRVVLDLIRAGDHLSAAERFVDDVALGPGAWAQLPAPMRATMVGNAATYLDEELAPGSRLVDEAALARYTGPVLISSGGQSPPIFQPVVQHLARLLPQAHCVEYAGAGHLPHLTHPEAFVNEVKTFTSRVNPSDHGSTARNRAITRDDVGRLLLQAPDGTPIAVWVEGEGPAMVLVHGSLQDHSLSGALVAELREAVTTYAIDRRGFGASGDAAEYAIEREFEDVAAVVDAVVARVAGPVAVWGHSYGASVAMGAATMSGNIDHLLLYEPSLGLAYPKGWIERLEKTVAEGGKEAAIVLVLKDILEFTDDQIDAMRSSPEWERRVAMANTVAREARAEDGWVCRPGQFGGINAKTLLLSGSESTPAIKQATDAAAAAIAGARIHVLDGHAHIAHRTDPAIVAAIVREFITSS